MLFEGGYKYPTWPVLSILTALSVAVAFGCYFFRDVSWLQTLQIFLTIESAALVLSAVSPIGLVPPQGRLVSRTRWFFKEHGGAPAQFNFLLLYLGFVFLAVGSALGTMSSSVAVDRNLSLSIDIDKDTWTILLPTLTVVGGWLVNEKARRRAAREEIERTEFGSKSQLFGELIGFARGFQNTGSSESRSSFLDGYRQLFLIGSDDTVRAANKLIDAIMNEEPEGNERMGEFIVQLRRDLHGRRPLSSTELGASDYRVVSSN